MSYQRGTNSGLSGIIDIPGVSGAKFNVRIYRWSPRMTGVPKPRRGRGGGVYRTLRWMMSAGTGACSGKPNLDGFPAPDAWKGQTGTLTVQVHTSKTVAYPVLITQMGFNYDEKTQDLPDVTFAWEITGEPTYTGWAQTQPQATDPTKADQVQWEGSSKTYDPNGLQDSANVLVDIWGTLGDTDAAETTKLVAVITAATAPMTNQKKRTATFQRDALDGGTITISFGLTDTAEDIINPNTSTTVDPSNLQSNATAAAINGNPVTPVDDVFQIRSTTTSELNDQKTLTRRTYGLNTTQQDREFDASGILDDPTDLEDGTEIALVQGSSTPSAPSTPAGLKIISTATKELTPAKWLHTFRYGRRDNKDTIEQEGTFNDIDVSDLTSEGRQTTVYTTAGGVPADPSPPTGLQIVSSRVTVRNNVKSIKTWIFKKDTTKQTAEQDASYTDVDPQGLETKKATASMDATPSTPAGTVERSTRTKNLTNDHTLTIVEGGLRSTADDETFGRTKIEIENNGASPKTGQETYTAEIITTGASFVAPSAPSTGMVCISYFDIPRTKSTTTNKSVRVYVWSLTTNVEKLQQPRYSNQVDPNGLDTVVHSATVWDGTSAPSDPALTGIRSGLKLVYKEDIGIPSHPATLIRVYRHEKNDSLDKLLLPRTTFEATSFLAQRAENPSLITTTSAASVTGLSVFNSFKDQITFEKVFAVKTDPDHTLQVITTQVAAKIVRGRSSGTRRVITPAFWDGTDVWVFMRRKLKIGTNSWDYELAEQYLYGQKICFSMSQRVSGSTLPYHPELLNTKNQSTFLGLAAGYVTYLGVADSATNLAVASDRVSEITWEFEYDTLGIIDMADASPGWSNTSTDLTSVGPGWVKASDLGLSSTVQPDGDYSVFA